MTAPPKPVAVEARCVRLNAKAENAAAVAPASPVSAIPVERELDL